MMVNMRKVQLFISTECERCDVFAKYLQQWSVQHPTVQVEILPVLEHPIDVVRHQIFYTPALVIDGQLIREKNLTQARIVQLLSSSQEDAQQQNQLATRIPANAQEELLYTLLSQGDAALHEQIQAVWPLDAEAAFGAIPTPLRLHADPRFTGKGVTIAMIDVGFYPHPDLIQPENRIRAWVNAAVEPATACLFSAHESPIWPEWDTRHNRQWHGMMTSVAAAGNGYLSDGLYRGLASDANVVLIQVRDDQSRQSNAGIVRALRWVLEHGEALDIGVVNVSLGGSPVETLRGNPIDEAVAALFAQNIVVTAASGNDGVRRLLPPATAPHALTIGGLDDQNTFGHEDNLLWHSNYGNGIDGAPKPELVAPSIWLAAPVLPGTALAKEAEQLLAKRQDAEQAKELAQRIAELKLINPHYQHVDGTSFAAPIVASTIACLLEANPALTPSLVREILVQSAQPVPGASRERQGAGTLTASKAVSMALHLTHHKLERYTTSPHITDAEILFALHAHDVTRVEIYGSWNGWAAPLELAEVEEGIWQGTLPRPAASGRYAYKFLLNGQRWLDDPANPRRTWDGAGGFNSLFELKEEVY